MDISKAIEMWTRAAMQGHPYAISCMGESFRDGQGVVSARVFEGVLSILRIAFVFCCCRRRIWLRQRDALRGARGGELMKAGCVYPNYCRCKSYHFKPRKR